MEKTVNVGFAASPSSSFIPKNYVSLRQLRDLRLKEKQDEEERLRNQKHQQTEEKRLEEDYLSYPDLHPTKRDRKEEGESKLHPKPPGLNNKGSPIGFRAVARTEPARRPEDGGPEGSASEADLKCVIGDAVGDPNPQIGQICNQTRKTEKKKSRKKKGKVGENPERLEAMLASVSVNPKEQENGEAVGNPNPQIGQICNQTKKTEKKKSRKKKKGKVGENPERLEAMLASVSVNPKEVSLENAVQLNERGGPDRWERAKQKPAGLQCSGSEQMMQIEQQSINGGTIPTAREAGRSWSTPRGGRSFPRPRRGGDVGRGGSMVGAADCPRPGRGGVVGGGASMIGDAAGPRPRRGGVVGRGGSMVGPAAGLVWVKKTQGS